MQEKKTNIFIILLHVLFALDNQTEYYTHLTTISIYIEIDCQVEITILVKFCGFCEKHVAKIWNANHIEANLLEMLFFLLLNSNTIQHIYCIAPTTVLQLRQRVERKKVWQWLINQICHVTFLKRSASFQKLIKTRNDRQHSYEHFLHSNFTPNDKLQISWHYG